MQIKRSNKNLFQLTLTGYELATLISSARYISEGAKGELNEAAISNAKHILVNYDKASQSLFNDIST
jgi:hypothetical protein